MVSLGKNKFLKDISITPIEYGETFIILSDIKHHKTWKNYNKTRMRLKSVAKVQ